MTLSCIKQAVESRYELLFTAALPIPWTHYLFGLLIILIVFVYNFRDMHFLQDLVTGFWRQPVTLTFSSSSKLYHDVVSKCKILHGRYLATPWLCSPHLQTIFLQYFGNAPAVNYRRQLFTASDGGTIALHWVINDDVKKPAIEVTDADQHYVGKPIMIIVPSLTSDSNSAYVKHLVFKMAKHGWNVVIINYRGLGGVPLTTDDIRTVVKQLHNQYPEAPLFVVGTSIGANLLLFYLGEDGINVPITGATSICCPWDPLLCDRILNRGYIQKIYSKALATGLKGYAHMHKAVMSRITNWEGIEKSLYLREFDDSSFRVVTNHETIDSYYRRGCTSPLVGKVMVPLVCITSLDDPICTNEAIPWDECRLNDNVVLATTQHGRHLPFFEGLTGKSLWWVRAVDEFFNVLQSNPKKEVQMQVSSIMKDVLVTELAEKCMNKHKEKGLICAELDEICMNKHKEKGLICAEGIVEEKQNEKSGLTSIAHSPNQLDKKCLNQLWRHNYKFFWLIAYNSMITTWPFLGLFFALFLRKRIQNLFSSTSLTRRR